MDWYYERGGERLGPVIAEKMQSLISAGDIAPETLVWNTSFGTTWRRAGDTELMAADIAGPPPLPTTHVSDAYAWLLALVPAIGAVVERAIADNGTQLSWKAVMLAYFGANTALSLLDANKINKAGRNPNNINLGRWFWLIPAYLYQRSRTLFQNQKFLIIWLVTFFGAMVWQTPGLLKGEVYLGFGLPTCNSASSVNQVKKIFGDIPLVKMYGVTAIDLTAINELSKNDKSRQCSGSVAASNGNTIAVRYTITEQGESYYYNVNIIN
ncbi:DUF4339 domain-containing protein [Methylobacterium mesophilicum]|nr:DUF4339 domain-containing protein [Methylobacterium mesophilicum]